MRPLYKTTIVIWSEEDPRRMDFDLSDLSRDAMNGDSYCSLSKTVFVECPEQDPNWDGTEFFNGEEEEEDEE